MEEKGERHESHYSGSNTIIITNTTTTSAPSREHLRRTIRHKT